MNVLKKNTELIKTKAKQLGFDICKITKVEEFDINTTKNYLSWIDNGYFADMEYMNRNIDKRFDINKMVENSKSVIIVALNYYSDCEPKNSKYKISKYAYGEDYHVVVKTKLYDLFNFINTEIAEIKGRVFVDSAPVLEKQWAVKAGIGWQGKNSCVINKNLGSFFFIGEIVIDLELAYDKPVNELCGNCTRCIDACPTNAIEKPYVVNSNKCISYLTIENKNEFDNDLNLDFKNYIFGCDICQDVCPWNSKPINTKIEEFTISEQIQKMDDNEWENINENKFNEIFKNSSAKRSKLQGLKRNINYVKNYK